jgi:hypothetical protein
VPLKTLLLNLLTFGYYGLKELAKLRNEEIAKAKEITNSASEIKNKLERTIPRPVPIQIFNTESDEYLRRIYEVAKDPAVRFFLYNIQQDVYDMLNNATDEKATEIMGMSKGIKYLLQGIETTRKQYEDASRKTPEIRTEDAIYV